jgi:thiol-disulfide isomerase/thioredoxin
MRLVTALLTAVLAVTTAGCGNSGDDPPTNRALSGQLLDGSSYDPGSTKGKVTVVNFWGSWCAPCRAETPELIAAYDQVKSDGVAFLGINVRDPDRDKAIAFVANFKVPYPSIYDPPGKVALAFDVPPSTVPTTLILRRDGTVAVQYREPLLREALADAVRRVSDG